ncbi:MAG: hypothetical protein IJ830_05855 [Alphaproteobacteria bacterium]|nr:hypothetical protein [Alphaproteobacteria bacterium]
MDLIELFRQRGFAEYEGISAREVEDYQKKLYQNGVANIPFEYAAFLSKINGVETDTLSLFGIRTNGSFVRDIYSENTTGNAVQNDEIFLGDNSEEYLFYSWPEKSFIVMNKQNREKFLAFAFLEPALKYFLRAYLISEERSDYIEKIKDKLKQK